MFPSQHQTTDKVTHFFASMQYQLSVFSSQLSVFSSQLSVFSSQLSVFSSQLSVISIRFSVFSYSCDFVRCAVVSSSIADCHNHDGTSSTCRPPFGLIHTVRASSSSWRAQCVAHISKSPDLLNSPFPVSCQYSVISFKLSVLSVACCGG